MKFALLGSDVESLSLTAAAVAAGHELVWVGDVPKSAITGESKQGQFPPWLTAWAEQDADGLIDGLLWADLARFPKAIGKSYSIDKRPMW